MQWNSRIHTRCLASLLALLPACGSLDFPSPQEDASIRTPASWQASGKGSEGRISTAWLDEFPDQRLHETVDRALERNQDLAATAARMREAEYTRIAGRSRLLPRAGLTTSASFSESRNGPAQAASSERYGLTVAAAWEVDLWRRLRDLTQADDADTVAVRAAYRGARLSLAASTAKSWCNLIAAEQQLELAQVTLESFQSNLRISERNYKGTGDGALDVQFGRTNVASARRSLESSRLQRDDAARALEVLTGSYPSGRASAGSDLPELRGSIPAGIPSDLLDRRPDLEIARARIYASAKRADAARKELLPRVDLTTSAGTPGTRFTNLLDPQWLATSIAANIIQNVYSGGQLSNQARAALERNQALVHDYTQSALIAFREVESALGADSSLAEQEVFLLQEVEQAALAEKQANRNYSEGIEGSNILDVLEAQRRANNARSGLIRLRNERLQNRIDLHLALGGDFRTRNP